nr:hypothetical protein [uncultured Anaeromusa sp.]
MKTLGLAWIIVEISNFISQWVPVGSPFTRDLQIILTVLWIFFWIICGLPLFAWDGRRRQKAIEAGDVKAIKIARYSTILNGTVVLAVFLFINQGVIIAGIMSLVIFSIFYFIGKSFDKRDIANVQRKKDENS